MESTCMSFSDLLLKMKKNQHYVLDTLLLENILNDKLNSAHISTRKVIPSNDEFYDDLIKDLQKQNLLCKLDDIKINIVALKKYALNQTSPDPSTMLRCYYI